MDKSKEMSMDTYFASEEHKLIFALVFTDTDLRAQLLGITEELYTDKQKAKEWRNSVAKKIHPDYCKIDGAAEATKKLNDFYKSMTEDEGDGDE